MIREILLSTLLCVSTVQAQTTLLPQGSTWKYDSTGTDLLTAWQLPGYDDTLWSSGPAQLGYGDADEATIIPGGPASARYPTSYFRTSFNVIDPAAFSSLVLNVLRDDGAVVYINGTEVRRDNMVASPTEILYGTWALGAVPSADESVFFPTSLPASVLVAGTNTIAVEVHQANATSSDLSFDLSLIGIPPTVTASVTRGPYLQLNTPTSVIVRWRTNIPTDSRVVFGNSAGNLTSSVADAVLTTEHSVALSGLSPDTRSYYAAGTTTQLLTTPGNSYFFETSPPVGSTQPHRFWILGDAGTATASQTSVRDSYDTFAAATRRSDLILLLGDNAYSSGTDIQYQAGIFNMYDTTIRNTPMWSCLGNHDGVSADSATNTGPYYDIFDLPRNAEAGGSASGTEAYYSFNYANIHFVVLDSYETDRSGTGAMANWLRQDLLNVTSQWLIAFFHHPPYTKGSHNSDTEIELLQMRQNFVPILEAAGVDLVLCGHSHSYERSKLIDNHIGDSTTFDPFLHIVQGTSGNPAVDAAYSKPMTLTPNRGTVYAVPGSAGQISGGPLNHPAMWISLNELGSMILDVEDHRLEAIFLNSGGVMRDAFVIEKGCEADFNSDGFVDFFDYLDFVDAFSSNLPIADFNQDSTIDFFDYLDFVDAFSIGC